LLNGTILSTLNIVRYPMEEITMSTPFSRRQFLRLSGMAVAGATLAACTAAPASAPAPAAAGGEAPAPDAAGTTIQFWTMTYADPEPYLEFMRGKADQFREETGIQVETEMINWSNAAQTWLLVSQGGAHPDVADMYWLYSFSKLGGGKAGPMPITDYLEIYWPDLEERFYASGLQDVFWQGEFYGIPWRGDIRPMLYRVDMLEEAGYSGPPQTWDEITEVAKATTKRDGADTSVWGFELSSAVPVQQFMAYLWQAGGEYMTKDGETATIDTPEMRKSLQFMYDHIWTHETMPREIMEKGHTPMDLFRSGQVAVIGQVSDSEGLTFDRDYPDMEGQWAFSVPAQGPVNRSAYSGAGYWGVLRGTEYVDESVRYVEFLSRDENMQEITEYIGRVSPNKNVMASPYWTDRPWKKVVVDTLEHAHTSQHPSPAWGVLTATEPGSVLYDLYYEALIQQQPFDDVLARAQTRAQAEMDKF
jgi:multiple sugar transport system substrate-binding protein